MEIEAKFKRKRNLYGEVVNKSKPNCLKKENKNHRQAHNIKSNYNESLLKIRSISSDIMSPKGQLGTAYRQFRKQAIEDLTTLGDSRGFSYTDIQNQSRQSNLSKSSSRSISDLLTGNKDNLNKSQRLGRYKCTKAMRKLTDLLSDKIKLTLFPCFNLIKRFEGFEKESSDDSLVKLD